jgi:hypothetical protein
MNTILILLLVLMPAACPCGQLPTLVDQAKENSSVSLNDLRNAPTEVLLDGRSVSLSAYLWRDFMPTTSDLNGSPDGKPMIAVFKVGTADKKPFPSGVRIDGAWVVFGERLWETSDFKEQVEGSSSNQDSSGKWITCSNSAVCEAVARGGPKWGPGVFVDVVVRLIDNQGRQHLLQAPKQYVSRTD